MDQKVTEYINNFTDWRRHTLEELREIINSHEEINEDFKWRVPVWTSNGLLCAISGFKEHVKINFFQGAHLLEQIHFNSGLDSKDHRSINFGPSDKVNKEIIDNLIEQAIKFNKDK